jgi:hypothetical protein
VQHGEGDKHYEGVDVSSVDVTPEDYNGDYEPDVQYVSIGGKDEYQQKNCYEQV